MASAEPTAKAGWEVKTLGEVCEFRNGLWKGKKPPYVHVGVIRNTNFTKAGCLDDSDIAYLDVEQKQFEKRRLEYGDIILEKSGGGPKQPVGRVITFEKTEGDFSFSNFTSVVRIIDSSAISFKFLHRFLYWNYLSGVTEGMQRRSTGIRNLDFTTYKQIPVPVPPLAEQERIVGILDEAFEGIAAATAQAEKNLHNARELFQSVLQSTFSQKGDEWEIKILGEMCNLEKTKYTGDQLPYVGMEDIESDTGTFTGNRHPLSVKSSTFAFTPDHMLYGRLRPYLNKVLLPDFEGHCSTEIFPIRPAPGLDRRFLFHWITNSKQVNRINLTCTGARMPRANLKEVLTFTIPVPPLPTQQAIVEKLDALSEETKRLEAIYERKKAALSELKQSLLQKAFAGEL